jgi:hypothetical protein
MQMKSARPFEDGDAAEEVGGDAVGRLGGAVGLARHREVAVVVDNHGRVAADAVGRDAALGDGVDSGLELHSGLRSEAADDADGFHEMVPWIR